MFHVALQEAPEILGVVYLVTWCGPDRLMLSALAEQISPPIAPRGYDDFESQLPSFFQDLGYLLLAMPLIRHV
jgi:hypothetical protein